MWLFIIGIVAVALIIWDHSMYEKPKHYSSKRGPGVDHVFDEDYVDSNFSGHGHGLDDF